MTLDEALTALRAKADPEVFARNARAGARNQIGVKLGDIRVIAKAARSDHGLGLALWQTGILDARLLALLIMQPRKLSVEELDRLVRENDLVPVAEWLNAYVVKAHPQKETLREAWMADPNPMVARSGWSLAAERVAKAPEGLDIPALLDRIAAQMPDADPVQQWTMNTTLAFIGIHHPAHRDRALTLGEAMGIFRDYPTPRGCTSPFAPIWIAEMVRRAG